MEKIKKYKHLLIISISFAVLYSLISLVNHYCFRTYALDLGLYTNAAFKYAHLQLADTTIITESPQLLLGGHFDLYLIIFAPFIYLFGTYTLLIVQIAALVIGGIGVYTYFKNEESKNKYIPILATLYFYSFFGVYGALSFDYHSIVVASCIVPWFFIAIRNDKKVLSILLLIALLISQENISLWAIFICLGLAIEFRKDSQKFRQLVLLACISFVYFITVIYAIIPYLSAENEYGGFLYSYLGNNALDAVKTMITNPLDSFSVLFTNHNNSLHGDYIKEEIHVILIASGLPLLIKKPQYIFMLLPIYFQKFFHDSPDIWGLGGHYNIEFAPIMAIGIFKVISEFKRITLNKTMAFLVLFLALVSTIRTMDNTIKYTDKSRIRFYKLSHYERDYNVKAVHQQLKKIPATAKVSAQSPFVPHLALREGIYQFPIIKDADYIVYSKIEGSYPLSQDDFELKLIDLEESGNWEKMYDDGVTILKRFK